ncbi:MAG: PH domain-containing protein [Syntrophorhabdus sp.]
MVDDSHVFTASRLTPGNRLFPVRIEVNQNRVTRIKRRLFGSNEESIAIQKVASVNIQTGLMWSDIRIDSAGGSDPFVCHGHRKDDARAIRDLIERFQKTLRAAQGPDA